MSAQLIPYSKDSRVLIQQAEATIQNLPDAAVELITNCDDSYDRLENTDQHCGKIEFYASRESGGRCQTFWIRDYAEGLNKEKLEKAIIYGEESSGFQEGKSVRGLLGRGLKESIIGLGEGIILARKDDILNIVKIWREGKNAYYDFIGKEIIEQNDQDINNFIDSKGNCTFIKIKVKNEKIKIPECDKFILQITNHYALRDINSSKNRDVILNFEDLKRKLKNSSHIKFAPSDGELIINKTLYLPKYRDSIQIKIWESPISLNSQPVRYDPFSRAGILIKTENAILDNQLFEHDGNPAAFYFYGEAYCDGIAQKLREANKQGKETEIIDSTRKGLNWRSDYCGAIQKTINEQLTPLIQRKRKELEKGEKKEVPNAKKKVLKNICKVLDKLARKEFKEWEGPLQKEFHELTLIPAFTTIEVDKPRPLSIYAPKELIESSGTKTSVKSDRGDIQILLPGSKRLGLSWDINLDQHPTNPNMYYKSFKIIGREIGKEAFIYCKLGDQEAGAEVKVVEEKTQIRRRKRKERWFYFRY